MVIKYIVHIHVTVQSLLAYLLYLYIQQFGESYATVVVQWVLKCMYTSACGDIVYYIEFI